MLQTHGVGVRFFGLPQVLVLLHLVPLCLVQSGQVVERARYGLSVLADGLALQVQGLQVEVLSPGPVFQPFLEHSHVPQSHRVGGMLLTKCGLQNQERLIIHLIGIFQVIAPHMEHRNVREHAGIHRTVGLVGGLKGNLSPLKLLGRLVLQSLGIVQTAERAGGCGKKYMANPWGLGKNLLGLGQLLLSFRKIGHHLIQLPQRQHRFPNRWVVISKALPPNFLRPQKSEISIFQFPSPLGHGRLGVNEGGILWGVLAAAALQDLIDRPKEALTLIQLPSYLHEQSQIQQGGTVRWVGRPQRTLLDLQSFS
mmetsp:Transcript_772/g.1825  ORF Transcript_772/g.1825 Transcript_772/m.1825 type:complete len:310 (+) Transcript_772:99-1028(+)